MIEFKLPYLGADIEEGTLLEWRIKPGDQVSKGAVVAVVDTAKAAVDIESWDEGTVAELLVEPDALMPVGATMALLLEAGESAEQAARWRATHAVAAVRAVAPKPQAGGPAAVPLGVTQAPAAGAGRRRVSPAARKRAAELAVKVDDVIGTGPDGAVTVADVEHAASAAPPAKDKAAEMRRIIAAAMVRSKREIPHYYLAEDVVLARATQWLKETNAARPISERLLLAPLYVKAVALALKQYPELNGFWRDNAFVSAGGIHVGVAVSLRQGGLIAPAIHDADQKDLTVLMRELADLVKRTRAGSLKSSEMADPTVTITNLGDQGVASVFGVIYPPQVALIGFGRVRQQPWAIDDQVRITPLVSMSLSADHRVSDGHRGALFLAAVRDLLQQPEKLEAKGG